MRQICIYSSMQKLTIEQLRTLFDADPERFFTLFLQLFEANEALAEQVTLLQARVKELEAQLAKDSHNSHKPPSSDGMRKKTKSLRKSGKRKAGGQKGRKGYTLKQTAKPDQIIIHSVEDCPACKTSLNTTKVKACEKRQVFDIPPATIQVTEHQAEIKKCPNCQKAVKAMFPSDVSQPAQYGNRIKAVVLYLMNQHLLPYKRTAEILQDLYGVKISPGTLFNINKVFYAAIEKPVQTIKEQIIASKVAHFDESGIRTEKTTQWLHTAGTEKWTYYTIHKKRGVKAMDDADILPKFKGKAVHDHWKPYFKYLCLHCLCNAHHLRELIYLFEEEKQSWAKSMIDLLMKIKHTVEHCKEIGKNCLDTRQITLFLKKYDLIVDQGFLTNPDRDPKRHRKKKSKAQNLLYRFKNFRGQILAFMYDFSVPFDNNLAERDIRMIKVKQNISGCFRKQHGANMFCRIKSYTSSAKKQEYNIISSIMAALNDQNIFWAEMAE